MSDEEDEQLMLEVKVLENVIARKRNLTSSQTDSTVLALNGNASPKAGKSIDKVELIVDHADEENVIEVFDEDSSVNSYDDYSCKNLQDLLDLNIKLLDTVSTARDKMQSLLDDCLKRKQMVTEQISKRSSSWQTKIINFNAGMPYFKDKNHYTCKRNEDTETKIKKGELRLAQLQCIHRWNQHDKSNLLKTIRHEVTLMLPDREEPDENYINDSIKKTSQLPLDVKKAIGSLGSKKLDWLRIASNIPENKHSAEECKVMWNVFLHPTINKQKWTSREDKKLNQVVEEHDFEDWDAIAKALGTKRSGYQCFIRYNTNNWKNLMKGQSWTAFDDRTLCHLIDKLKIGDYVPWGYIASCMNNWTKQQVYFRWMYSLAPHLKKGRYSPEEDEQLLKAVEKYGTNFSKISALVLTNRTQIQLKEHYLMLNQRTNHNRKIWTYEEDTLLVELREKHGPKWAKIVQQLPGTTRVQARQRYDSLVRYMKRGVSLQNINREDDINLPTHTTVTYTTNTPWSRENKEIEISHLKIDDQLINFFKRESAAKKEERLEKTYEAQALAKDTKKLYDTLVKLNVNVNVPEYANDSDELNEKYLYLLSSLQDYADSRMNTYSEKVESVRLKMFGPHDPLAKTEHFVPPLPFNFCVPKNSVYKKSNSSSGNGIDAASTSECHQIQIAKELQPEREVKNYLEESVEIQFEKLKELMVAPTHKFLPKIYSLRCKSFASKFNSGNSESSRKMKYDWQFNRMLPIDSSDQTTIVLEPSIPLSVFEPSRKTLETYQEVIHLSSSFSEESDTSKNPSFKLTSRGREALNTFKRRYQQLFQMPTGLSRIIPPDTVDESAFLPALEKLKKQTNTRKRPRKTKGAQKNLDYQPIKRPNYTIDAVEEVDSE